MPQTTLYARTGEAIGTVELSEELFAAPVNAAVLHQVVTAQLAGRRLGTSDTKTRGEVRGGGKSQRFRHQAMCSIWWIRVALSKTSRRCSRTHMALA